MTGLELFWGSASAPSWRVMLALRRKGVPATERWLSLPEGENRRPEFLAVNPRVLGWQCSVAPNRREFVAVHCGPSGGIEELPVPPPPASAGQLQIGPHGVPSRSPLQQVTQIGIPKKS